MKNILKTSTAVVLLTIGSFGVISLQAQENTTNNAGSHSGNMMENMGMRGMMGNKDMMNKMNKMMDGCLKMMENHPQDHHDMMNKPSEDIKQ
mgnify:CR=1 FL=1